MATWNEATAIVARRAAMPWWKRWAVDAWEWSRDDGWILLTLAVLYGSIGIGIIINL